VVISVLWGDGGRHVLKEIWVPLSKRNGNEAIAFSPVVSLNADGVYLPSAISAYLPLLYHRCLRIFHVAEDMSAFKVCMKQLDFSLYIVHDAYY
jgi:hypothetical protein